MAQILIIDDDKMLSKTLARYVQKTGHTVTSALTLEAGLREIPLSPFAVVFLDVNLPDGNGLDALPLIRNAPSSPEVIIITGEGDPDGAQIAMECGALGLCGKAPVHGKRGVAIEPCPSVPQGENKQAAAGCAKEGRNCRDQP